MKSLSFLFARGISAAIFVLLSACGGHIEESGSHSTQYALPPTLSPTTITFNGYRANYQISSVSDTMIVVDKFGSDGEIKVGAGIEQLIFKDVSINLALPNLVKMMNEKDVVAIIELYIAYFQRVPDANGLKYWCTQFKQGMSIENIGESFYSAGLVYSSVTGYTPNMTNSEFVRIVYKNVLGRDNPDAEGLAYWTNALAGGRETRGTLIRTMLASAHSFKGNVEYGWVADLLDNRAVVGRDFAITRGYSYINDQDSITKGMQIAGVVTARGVTDAINFIDELSGVKLPSSTVGTFRDSIVQGIRYVATAPNGTVRQGITNDKGEYQFFENGRIEFYVGNILIGLVEQPTATTVTAYLRNEPAATNIARFLQTLDVDSDPTNGIAIPVGVIANAEKVQGLDFSASNFDANFNAIKNTLMQNSEIPTNRELVTSYDASEHAVKAAQLVLNDGSRLTRVIQGKLTYPSSYNNAILRNSEFQRVRVYIWEDQIRTGLDSAMLAYSGNIQTTDGEREMVKVFTDYSTAVLEAMSISTNLKTLAIRGIGGVSTARKLAFTVPLIEDSGVSACSISATISDESNGVFPVDMNIKDFCSYYKALHGSMAVGYDGTNINMNDVLMDTALQIEKSALKTINKNRLLVNMLNVADLAKLEPVDVIKVELKAVQAVADFRAALKVDADNRTLTNYLIARMYLDLWIKSAGDSSFMKNAIFGQTGISSNNREEQIAALVKFYGQTGIWCDVKTFFKGGFLTGVSDISEGKYSPGKFCEPNVDYVAINKIIDSRVVAINEILRVYQNLIGPLAGSVSSGMFDIPLAQSNTASISKVVATSGNPNTAILSGTTTSYASFTLTGSTTGALKSGERVAVYDGDQFLGTALMMGGQWTFSTGALKEGSHSLAAGVLSAGGLSGLRSPKWIVDVKPVCQLSQTMLNSLCVDTDYVNAIQGGQAATYLISTLNTLYGTGNVNMTGTSGLINTLTYVPILTDVISVHEGTALLALKKDGVLMGRGFVYGAARPTIDQFQPIMTNVKYAVSGNYQTMILTNDGKLWAAGNNNYGQLGTNDFTAKSDFINVLDSVTYVTAKATTFAIRNDSSLWATGSNRYGQLCFNSGGLDQAAFKEIARDVVAVANSGSHTLILKKDGSLYGCGDNSSGQLGLGQDEGTFPPVKILSGVAKISAGSGHSLALKTDGTLWGTGLNGFGQLGTGDTTHRYYFAQLKNNVKQISAGSGHTIIQLNDNTLWVAGSNFDGQFGNGSNKNMSNVFVPMRSPFNVVTGQPGEVDVSGMQIPKVIQ